MNDDRPTRDSMSLEEATVSNIWEIAAIMEVLERKSLCTKQNLYNLKIESRHLLPVRIHSMLTDRRSFEKMGEGAWPVSAI
jgi:hemerythrin superfamily protein